jgi:hypothetical protein
VLWNVCVVVVEYLTVVGDFFKNTSKVKYSNKRYGVVVMLCESCEESEQATANNSEVISRFLYSTTFRNDF